MSKYSIEVFDKIQQLITQVIHRGERTTADHFPHDHSEDRLDLVQPRTVLRRVHEPDAVTRLRQELLAARHRFQYPAHPLLAQRRRDLTRLGHHLHQGLRTMDVQVIRHEHPRRAPGRSAIVCSMWLAKSASVRVGPIVGAINSPVVTWKLPIRVNVPCRSYSNSIRAGFPAIIGLVGRDPFQRLDARHLVHADGMGVLSPLHLRCREVRVADRLDLLLKLLRVLLGGVEPIPALVGLHGGLAEVAAHLGRRDRRDDAPLDDLVGQFVGRPVGDGPAGLLGGLAGDREDLGDLLRGELAGGAGAGFVGEQRFDGPTQVGFGLAALQVNEAGTKPWPSVVASVRLGVVPGRPLQRCLRCEGRRRPRG